MRIRNQKQAFLAGLAFALVLGVLIQGSSFVVSRMNMTHNDAMFSAEYNKKVGTEVKGGITNLIAEGRYKCCLENPCSYCFTDEEHQDRELVCGCLENIMNGKHPCGECIGEIMEGKGNELIAEYFATAIAEEVGVEHLGTLQQIITEKYGIPVTQQL